MRHRVAGPFTKVKDESFWRRIAIANWDHPNDPQIFATLEVDATSMLEVLEEANRGDGPKVTPTHMVGKAVGEAFGEYPQANGIIVRGSVRQRETVDVWFNVAFDDGDLFGAKVEDVQAKSTREVAGALSAKAAKIRAKRDERVDNYKGITHSVPAWLLKPVLWLVDVINFRLGIPLTWFGVERDPFGTMMITNVATFDVEQAVYAPIPPVMRLPMVAVVGKIHDRVVAEDGQPAVRPILPIYVTADHRYLDGFQAVKMWNAFREHLTDEALLRRALDEA